MQRGRAAAPLPRLRYYTAHLAICVNLYLYIFTMPDPVCTGLSTGQPGQPLCHFLSEQQCPTAFTPPVFALSISSVSDKHMLYLGGSPDQQASD